MGSPYGGDRGGGRKSGRKPGGQPGNVNRRASAFLPPAKDTAERRAFLDALAKGEKLNAHEQTHTLRELAFAKVMSLAESVGITSVLRALHVIDRHRWTELKVSRMGEADRREALKDGALGDIWKSCGECERCGEQMDAVLRGLELQLRQIGGVSDGEPWMGRAGEDADGAG